MKIKILCFFTVIISSSLYCQSSIVYGAGTSINIGAGADVCAQVITVNGTVSGGGNFCGGPLPVEMVSFTARTVKENVELHWKTATEINNYGFEVQRSVFSNQLSETDNKILTAESNQWNAISFVEGSGTTNAPKEYAYSDKNLHAGKYLYRLKQVDRDGKFEYSPSVEVIVGIVPNVFELEQNYPNPFNPSTTISYQIQRVNIVSLKVFDAIGGEVATLVNETKDAGYYSIRFDAKKLASGIYFVRLQSGDEMKMRKIQLIK